MYTVPSTYLCVNINSPVFQSGQKGIMQLHSTVDVTTEFQVYSSRSRRGCPERMWTCLQVSRNANEYSYKLYM